MIDDAYIASGTCVQVVPQRAVPDTAARRGLLQVRSFLYQSFLDPVP